MMGGYGHFFNGFWGMSIIGMVVQLAVVIGVLFLIVHFLRGFSQQHANRPSTALQILEERFARGEISEEEFKKMREVLAAEGL
ncbi:SHOCT domain-containing protein [Ferviditalea candida]|uniref:SHOCT domain-containing protein n=1 Tax=Ferviditalea candida TaxID=3108399 RepID=A0ABU5ZE72_9BACL|nr:SHOCT domain-containing protein [Paenibacillaceae bacterium T2]